MSNDRTREKRTYPFFRQRPSFASTSGGTVPTGTGFIHVTGGSQDAAAKLVEDADVASSAAISSTKLSFASSTPITFVMSITASLGISAARGTFTQLSGSLQRLPTGETYIVGQGSVTVTTSSLGQVVISGSAGSAGAPVTAQYVTLATDATLASERVLTSGGGVTLTDAGAGSTVTLGISNSTIATISGSTFAQLSGSLQRTASGLSYLVGAGNVSISSQSNGQLVISASSFSLQDSFVTASLFKDVSFSSTFFSTQLNVFTSVGARKLDMSTFPATSTGLTRHVKFIADVQKTSGATSVETQLYDVTNGFSVSDLIYSGSNILTEISSSDLTVGSSNGNVRNDVPTMYEVDVRMNGGGVNDIVYITNARLQISYV